VQDDALRVFEDCMVCQNREADQQITCCAQFLCLPCARNLAIPRVVEDVALPFNLCPFCRSDVNVRNNAKSDSCLNAKKNAENGESKGVV